MAENSRPRRRRILRPASPERRSPAPSVEDTPLSRHHHHREPQQHHHAVPLSRPYMKQIYLHPSGCQQWSSQVVAAGGIYMAYASTLTTYVYDTRDFSLVTILGGNDCNVHSILWHPTDPHRILVISTNGQGSEWDVRTEERVNDISVGAPPACSAWDPSEPAHLAVISREGNDTFLMGEGSGGAQFYKDYSRRSSDQSLKATCTKWSQYEYGVLVTGWTDGRVSFSEATPSVGKGGGTRGKAKLVCPSEGTGSVVDLRHDPNKGPYVLVGYSSGTVVLWDATGHCSVATFDHCMVGLVGVRWMAWAPGNFLALSSKTGVGKVFNISNNHTIGSIKLGETGSGVRDMAWLPNQVGSPESEWASGPRAICGFRDGSLSVVDTAFRGAGGQAGGGGGGFSGQSRGGGWGTGAIPWASKAAHVETVFTCEHSPGDPNTIATGSYGSCVKVWYLPTMDLKVTLSGQTGAIYCVAWSLDGERIASTSAEGTVWIWDVSTGRALERCRLHSRAVHRVQWDPFHRMRLASVGADRRLVIFSDKGMVQRVFVHPDALFGCSWCSTQSNVIATACKDGNVRVFDCSWKEGLDPQYVLSGHTQRVFNVCWSPLLNGTLASGSDDTTIMVWCLHPKSLPRSEPAGAALKVRPSAVLTGHTSNVRPIHWNSEVPWLLLSGSWDGTVRAWDIRKAGVGRPSGSSALSGGETVDRDVLAPAASLSQVEGRSACIACMFDHVADVYGLSASPSRPFCYTSVSRDTTLRVFNLEGVVSSIKARAVIAKSLQSALRDTAGSMLPAAPPALCGTASRFVETQLRSIRRSEGNSSIAAFRKLFDFLWGPDGVETFWEVMRWVDAAATASPGTNGAVTARRVEVALAEDQQHSRPSGGSGGGPGLPDTEGDKARDSRVESMLQKMPSGLMCVEERVMHRNKRRASDGALARLLSASQTFVVQDRRLGKSERLERAFRLHLASGDLRSSCEALIALGRWQTALSLAPGVGLSYWRAVTDRYVEVLRYGAWAREDCLASGAAGGGLAATDSAALATALLSSTGRPLDAIQSVIGRSEEALSLAVAVADGAYPPAARKEPSSREKRSLSVNAAAYEVAEEKMDNRQHTEERGGRAAEAAAVRVRAEEDGGGDAKLHGLIHDHSEEEHATKGIRGVADARTVDEPHSNHEVMQVATAAVATAAASATVIETSAAAAQRDHGEALLRSITKSQADAFFQASQPALAAAAVLSICDGSRATASPALAFLLRGDEPELAYAAATVLKFPARELTVFVREIARRAEAWGDFNLAAELLSNAVGEDEFCNDFLRKHRSSGDNAVFDGGDPPPADGGFWPPDVYGVCGEESGPRGAAMVAARAAPSSRRNDDAIARQGNNKPCPSLSLRSRASYLEDAAAAKRRGMDNEAVRLLVLGDDLEQACELGIAFLRQNVPVLTFPPRPVNMSAFAVVRALGSGSDGGLASFRVSPRRRMEVLAYASYIGAIEAVVRGYNPVVAALLRTASRCARATERMVLGDGRQARSPTGANEKRSGEMDARESAAAGPGTWTTERRRSPSPSRRRGITRRSGRSPPSPGRSRSPSSLCEGDGHSRSSPFPSCMSATALASAAARHLTWWTEERDDTSTLCASPSRIKARSNTAGGSTRDALEVEPCFARQILDEESRSIANEEKAGGDSIFSADRRASDCGVAAKPLEEQREQRVRVASEASPALGAPKSPAHSSIPLAAESKRRLDGSVCGGNDDGPRQAKGLPLEEKGNSAEATFPKRRFGRKEKPVSGCGRSGVVRAARIRSSLSPLRSAYGEIIVSGSRLPSARHHERVTWRTSNGGWGSTVSSPPDDKRPQQPLATISLDFGQETLTQARGAVFMLEDGETCLGLNEAVMWSKVNPFSPLNTGYRITPF